jgi:hypothetical protein
MAETTTAPAGLPIASPKFVLYGKNKTQITFAVSGGNFYCSVSQDNNRVFNKSFTPSSIALFKEELKKLKAASPGHVSSWVSRSRDNTEKWAPGQQTKFKLDYVIKITKTEGMVYVFELSDDKTTWAAQIMCAVGLGTGSEQFGDADRSGLGLTMLLDWLTLSVPVALVLTNRPREYKPQGGGNSDSGNSSPNTAPVSGSAAAGWDGDDKPF